jgi:hypothetical protein
VNKSVQPLAPHDRVRTEEFEESVDLEKRRLGCGAYDGPIAAPRPLFGPRTQASANRIQREIPRKFKEMFVGPNHDRMKATLEKMPGQGVTGVERLRVPAVEELEAGRKICAGRFHDKVVMVFHQTIRVANPSQSCGDPVE